MSTTTSETPPPGWDENPLAAAIDSLRRLRWCALAIGACVVALGAAGCGGSSGTSSSSVPKLTRAADGSYVAHVKDAKTANAACDKKGQRALGQELKKFGAGGDTTTTTPFGTQQVQSGTGSAIVSIQYGQPTASGQIKATVCNVPVAK